MWANQSKFSLIKKYTTKCYLAFFSRIRTRTVSLYKFKLKKMNNKSIIHLDLCLTHNISEVCAIFNYNNLNTMLPFLVKKRKAETGTADILFFKH
jgi:hypothetical protein